MTAAGTRSRGPNFFCIGPARSATTWLADQLKLHSDIWLPPIQEIRYLQAGFSRYLGSEHIELRWDWWNTVKRIVRNKGLSSRADRAFFEAAARLAEMPDDVRDLEAYRRLFAPAGDRITGDISPIYACMTEQQVRNCAPVLRNRPVFMIARDPVDRFWSAMSMYARKRMLGDIDYGSVEAAKMLFHEPVRSRHHFPTRIIRQWNRGLGEERLGIFFFDDIVSRPELSLREIVRFIGADYRRRLPLVSPGQNRKKGFEKLLSNPDAREWVREAFQSELEACASQFGHFGESWLMKHRLPEIAVKG